MEEQRIKEYNSRLLSMLSVYINCYADSVCASDVNDIAHGCHVSTEYAYAQLLAALCGVDSAGHDREFFSQWLAPSVFRLDSAVFLSDSYLNTVHFPAVECGEWELRYGRYAPYEAFVCGDLRTYPNGKVLPQIGFFEKEFSFPLVSQGGREWMSVVPNEIVTMAPAIKRAFGRVLTFGLGLGYFAFHCAAKGEVSSVTVVERDQSVISLFERYILPQIPFRDKISIIHMDAFEYAQKHMAECGYDYIYTDIWHDPSDGAELYLKMKEHERYAPGAVFEYWCEDTIRCYL